MLNFNVFGLKLYISPTFLTLMILLFYMGNAKLAVTSAFFSILHEYAHAYAAKKTGYTPLKVYAGLFGGVLHLKEGYIKPEKEIIINSAGPLFNLSIALISYLLMLLVGYKWLYYIISANLILALFNLMPFYPLDGGKLLNVCLTKTLGFRKGYIVSKSLSIFFCFILFLFGIYLVQYNVVNLIICALAVNLYVAGREDNRYSYNRLRAVYSKLEEVDHK